MAILVHVGIPQHSRGVVGDAVAVVVDLVAEFVRLRIRRRLRVIAVRVVFHVAGRLRAIQLRDIRVAELVVVEVLVEQRIHTAARGTRRVRSDRRIRIQGKRHVRTPNEGDEHEREIQIASLHGELLVAL